jgi:DNA-binding NarL/FixJ family response regulator
VSRHRVLLVDDHVMMRAGLRALIEAFDGFEVVGEAGDGRAGVRLARQLEPDVVVMDLTMPGLNGLDATVRIVEERNRTRVVVLSMHTDEHYVLEALRAGASAYVVKEAAVSELEQALRAAVRGERYLSPAVSHHVLDEYLRLARGGPGGSEPRSGLELLTQRQREILQLIAEGNSTRAIAQRLSISIKTVEAHRSQIMERLEIHDVAGLTRFAIRVGLIPPGT